MTVLSPIQVVGLIKDVDLRLNDGQITPVQLVIATYIVMRESGGNSQALNTEGNTPAGSRDRGLWQFNDYWNKDVNDLQAFDPVQSTEIAFRKSNGWTNWKPWGAETNAGILASINSTHEKDAAKKAQQAVEESGTELPEGGGIGLDDIPVIGGPLDAAADAADTVADIGTSVARFIAKLMSPDFWRRIGIGALGLIIVVGALVLIFKDQAIAAAVPTPTNIAKAAT